VNVIAAPSATTAARDTAPEAAASVRTYRQTVPAGTVATTLDHTQPSADSAAVQAQFAAIRKLLADGQQDAARERLLAMVKRDPNVQIPADLQVLLPRP
jgi:thioredoxin-like negative regulator of GroEL